MISEKGLAAGTFSALPCACTLVGGDRGRGQVTLFVTGLITTTVDPYVLFRAFRGSLWMKINHGEHGGHGAVSLGDGLHGGKCRGKKALVEIDEQAEANVGNAPRWHTLEHSRSKDGCSALPSPCARCSPWLI
jgi:hypothetical protein